MSDYTPYVPNIEMNDVENWSDLVTQGVALHTLGFQSEQQIVIRSSPIDVHCSTYLFPVISPETHPVLIWKKMVQQQYGLVLGFEFS